ncbi:MAG: ABC transporter ATP-binding protein, partial [Candidatus Eremiobacterota bacterium]
PPPSRPLPFQSGVELRQVSFAYDAAPVLREVSLTVPRGAWLGLAGRTGEGKTTLAEVLAGYLVPQQGQVLVDGQTLTPATAPGWMLNVGYVPQDVYVLDDTVLANIAFGLPVDRQAAERAARLACLHEFVAELGQGYSSVLGERGVTLSGGQRQRLGLARALYHAPALLILDEATSALDAETESRVLGSLGSLKPDVTVVVISHRPSALSLCDSVYRLAEGRLEQAAPQPA